MLKVEKKGGTMNFWGDWFGRPMDNVHGLVNAEMIDNQCILHFNAGEKCTVTDPVGIVSTSTDFYIKDATKILWEWYLYGMDQIEKNKRSILYVRKSKTVVIKSSGNGFRSINPQGHHALRII